VATCGHRDRKAFAGDLCVASKSSFAGVAVVTCLLETSEQSERLPRSQIDLITVRHCAGRIAHDAAVSGPYHRPGGRATALRHRRGSPHGEPMFPGREAAFPFNLEGGSRESIHLEEERRTDRRAAGRDRARPCSDPQTRRRSDAAQAVARRGTGFHHQGIHSAPGDAAPQVPHATSDCGSSGPLPETDHTRDAEGMPTVPRLSKGLAGHDQDMTPA
jgi:hypothetical protein